MVGARGGVAGERAGRGRVQRQAWVLGEAAAMVGESAATQSQDDGSDEQARPVREGPAPGVAGAREQAFADRRALRARIGRGPGRADATTLGAVFDALRAGGAR